MIFMTRTALAHTNLCLKMWSMRLDILIRALSMAGISVLWNNFSFQFRTKSKMQNFPPNESLPKKENNQFWKNQNWLFQNVSRLPDCLLAGQHSEPATWTARELEALALWQSIKLGIWRARETEKVGSELLRKQAYFCLIPIKTFNRNMFPFKFQFHWFSIFWQNCFIRKCPTSSNHESCYATLKNENYHFSY